MITERDKDIIEFIDKIGFASIKNISDMFFTDCRYGYDLARKRLKKIYEVNRYIKKFTNLETNEIVYAPMDSRIKRVSIHNMKILEYICKLRCLGCEIDEVEFEPVFGDIKPDLYITFKFNNYEYFQILELQVRHDFVDLERYNKPKTLNEIVKRTGDILPKLVIIQDTRKDYVYDNTTQFEIAQLGLDMKGMAKVL